ncbi:MAG TPA: NAD(P)-dependent oxidoreductase [Stellaceae bacterium]|nr:NAD(P)-dependent oxidoreductase [Stellaceae bacterium]
MNVLVTGHKGYIGSHLVGLLKERGDQVTGCDLGLFEGCGWDPLVPPDRELRVDYRTLAEKDLAPFDCVMHLGAISNDPMGELDPEITRRVNARGSVTLAETCARAGVPRFLFASSCSIYGKAASLDLDEWAELSPVSAYAESKIAAEAAISKLAGPDFSPSYLRNATAYGYSPMLRIDLVVNNLLGCAVAKGDIRIMSDGTPWRPLIHCKDIARAFVAFMAAPRERVYNRAVNVGGNEENFQVRDVADIVRELVPSASIVYTGEIGNDPRNYRVKFDLLSELLPDFQLEYDLRSGMEELYRSYRDHGFSEKDFDGERFVRLRTLRHRLDRLAD